MNNNYEIFFTLFIVMIAVLIMEMRLSAKWNSFYFLNGPIIFIKKYRVDSLDNINNLSGKLENAFSSSYMPTILFKKLDKNILAFREKLFDFVLLTYTPVMHGTIIFNKGEMIVKGRLNWFTTVFSLIFLIAPLGYSISRFFMVLLLLVLLLLLYGIQYYRFSKIADKAIEYVNPK